MNKNTRNILLAVILLIVLLIAPFRWKIMAAIKGEDADTGASPETGVSCTVEITGQDGDPLLEQTGTWGETVLDALQTVCKENGLSVTIEGAYVTAIGDLSEGPTSGWTYTLNGESVMVRADQQKLAEGDAVVWCFVTSWE